ncbi:unnamed protein product [Dracunculus medinensis]|uniref:CUB domain-containing protein n=1 Tax=Dracunculus medinensis TaxID=318479 RepID=A0A0N4UJE2_DRAME|nr:unnamed protein product [Dracunculus medinensis]
MTYQCPDGYFLSMFSSAHDGSERFYKFGCTKFSDVHLAIDENCNVSESTSPENGDLYLSCGSDQYTAGIEIIDSSKENSGLWQLLCCYSDLINIRKSDCIDTKFLNDLRRASSFSSGTQIIRRWQAMLENGDLRWWLQVCPVDIERSKAYQESSNEIRARRQIPSEWSRGRFPTMELYPLFMKQKYIDKHRQLRLFDSNKRMHIFSDTKNSTSKKSTKNNGTSTDISTVPSNHGQPKFTKISTITAKVKKEDGAIDYYDAYDENFDRKKYEGRGGILSGVSDLLQNLQDGLSIAQAAFPKKTNLKLSYPTSTEPAFLLSHDEDSLSIRINHEADKNINSVVNMRRLGPYPEKPEKPQQEKQNSLAPLKIDAGSIQQMLQFLGLCNGHTS